MSQLAGTWVAGDSGRELQYFVEQNGTPLDVTGATNIVVSLVRQSAGSDVSVVVTGAVLNPGSDGGFTWAGANAIGLFVPQPSARQAPDIYEARVSFTLDGLVYWTDAFRVAVSRWGLSTIPTAAIGLSTTTGLQEVVDAFGGNGGRIDLGGSGGIYYADPDDPSVPLTMPGGVEILGAGRTATIIGSPVLISGAGGGLEDVWVRPDGTAYGIRIYNGGAFVARCFFRRVLVGATFKGAGDGPVDGVQLDGAGVLLAEHLTCAFCTGYGLIADSTGAEPNTTLKFDVCSFVQNGTLNGGGPGVNTGGGVRLLQSMTAAEFNGGNIEDNAVNDFYAENAALLSLLGVDFEHSVTHFTLTNVAEFQNCNTIAIEGCNFLKTGGATRAYSIQGCNGVSIGMGRPNRYEGWGAVGVGRIGETSRNVARGADHIFNGAGWIEDYSR